MSSQFARQSTVEDVNDKDQRIQITGYVKNIVGDESFILDDNTGKINVSIKSVDFEFHENDLINVIGEIVKEGNNRTLTAEIIQDMNKLNFEYYLKLYELRKKY
ncbi:MAG TPA: NirD/YgiW/YdeI family stress tolerance protein [bacterium]|nr:NirD/YgiW/YdeI family stress tolerance protein [bacterium]